MGEKYIRHLHESGVRLVSRAPHLWHFDVYVGVRHLHMAAAASYSNSCNVLAYIGLGKKGSDLSTVACVTPKEAVAFVRKSARIGDPLGLLMYALAQHEGVPGVLEKGEREAARLFREIFAEGLARLHTAASADGREALTTAYESLSKLSECGGFEILARTGPWPNIDESSGLGFYANDAASQAELTRLLEGGLIRPIFVDTQELREEAMGGSVEAMLLYAGILYRGMHGVKRDVAQCLAWLERAEAERRDPSRNDVAVVVWGVDEVFLGRAPVALCDDERIVLSELVDCPGLAAIAATYLAKGDGVNRDDREGVKLLHKAVEYGVVQATRMLAACYLSGTGVARDVKRGVELLEQAARCGDAIAGAFYHFLFVKLISITTTSDYRARLRTQARSCRRAE